VENNNRTDHPSNCEVWSSDASWWVERSTLYHLHPLGGGSLYAESLTSFLSRLADAHLLPVKTLIRHLFFSQQRRQNPYGPHPHFWWVYGRMLNGPSPWANWWATKTAQLTGHHDLLLHNLVRWSSVLSIKSLLRPRAAWCSYCLEMQRQSDQPVHMQLLWAIVAVTVCPRHFVALSELCPTCARTQHPLEPAARVGYCAHCRSWLGDALPHTSARDDAEALWVAEAVGELIGYPLVDTLITPRVSFHHALTYFIGLQKNHLPTLANMVQLPKSILRNWLLGRDKPQLSTLLQFCARLNTRPLTLLNWNSPTWGTQTERLSNLC